MAFELGLQKCLGSFRIDEEVKGIAHRVNNIIRGLGREDISVPSEGHVVACR